MIRSKVTFRATLEVDVDGLQALNRVLSFYKETAVNTAWDQTVQDLNDEVRRLMEEVAAVGTRQLAIAAVPGPAPGPQVLLEGSTNVEAFTPPGPLPIPTEKTDGSGN